MAGGRGMPPFVLITGAFALGIGLSELCKSSSWVWAVIATAVFLLVGGIWAYVQGKRYSFLWLPLCFLCLGYAWMEIDRVSFPQQLNPFLGHYVKVEGVVERLPSVYPNRFVVVLDNPVVCLGKEKWQGSGKIQVVYYIPEGSADEDTVPQELAGKSLGSGLSPTVKIDAGSRKSEFGRMQQEPSPVYLFSNGAARDALASTAKAGTGSKGAQATALMPGAVVRVEGFLDLVPAPLSPGEFDYRHYLERRGIIAQVKAEGYPEIKAQGQGLSSFWAALRLRIVDGINSSLPEEESLFLQGLLLGSKEGMTPDDRDLYQKTGVMHLFAVSGLHLGFVFIALMAAAGSLGLKRLPTFILVTAGLWGYAALIDFTSPVTRAAVMATVGLAAYLWQERRNAINSLALAALVLLLLNPVVLFDPGFQLSFVATWGIIYLAVPLNRHLPLREGWREALTVPAAAQLAILPLTAIYFQRVAVLGILANVLVIPLAGLVVYLGLAGMLLAIAAPGIFNPFFLAAGALSLPIKGLLRLLAGVLGASFLVPPPPLWLCLLWFALLVVLGWALREGFAVSFPHFRYRSRASYWVMPSFIVFVCLLFLLCTGIWAGNSGKLEITFLNVGQGDAILVKTPSGRTMLVDAGGSPVYAGSSFDPGRQIVVPALARAGIRKLDLVVNSHPHEDHLGGVPAVLDNIQVGRYIAPPQEHTTPLVLKVQELLEEKKIPVSYVKTGAEINLDPNVKISVLGPPQTLFSGTRSDANNNSLVLHITYGKVSILLTGDLEQEGMLDLVSRFQGSNGIQADLLKCPHHGSSYSICPEFAAAIKPQLVVISVGRNSFGHPDAQTIRFWQEQGARVLRTDEDGHITILTDGANLIMPGT